MKLTVTFTYDGKEYNDFSDAIIVALTQLLNKHIKQTIQPFESEIAESGGQLNVNFLPSGDYEFEMNNIPEELRARIIKAFDPNESA